MISLGGTLCCKPHNECYSSTLSHGISKNSQHPPWVVHAAYWGPHIHYPRPQSPPPVIPGRNLWVRGCTASFCSLHYPEKSYKLYSKTVLVGVWVVFNHTVMHKPVNVPTQVIRPIGYLVLKIYIGVISYPCLYVRSEIRPPGDNLINERFLHKTIHFLLGITLICYSIKLAVKL